MRYIQTDLRQVIFFITTFVKIANMNAQDVLLAAIRKKTDAASLIGQIATALSISYDASHRRISSKSKFSIEETVALCRYFSLSMDAVFGNEAKVLVEKTKEITDFQDLAFYFEKSAEHLHYYASKPDTFLYYSAKDIPLFYMIGGALLSKFKLYVWMNLMAGKEASGSFEQFQIPTTLLPFTTKLKSVFDTVQVSEIWNDTTINSTLQQIVYFFESGLLSLSNAQMLLGDLQEILSGIEIKSGQNLSNYQLFYNELLILNNNVLLTHASKSSLFVPYTMLGYFITEDKSTCHNAGNYFRNQMHNSKSLNLSGTRDRKIFFNRAQRRIEHYAAKLEEEGDLLF